MRRCPIENGSWLIIDYSKIDKASVSWAYSNASTVLQTELARVQSLNEKAAQLAGFCGVTLAILGGLADGGFGAKLGSVGEPVFAACYFGAALLLGAAIAWLVLFVYRPRRYVALDPSEIRNYLTEERLLRAEPWALQMRTMRTLYLAASWAEKGAAQMARRITVGALLFTAGLMLFVCAAITLGVGEL